MFIRFSSASILFAMYFVEKKKSKIMSVQQTSDPRDDGTVLKLALVVLILLFGSLGVVTYGPALHLLHILVGVALRGC